MSIFVDFHMVISLQIKPLDPALTVEEKHLTLGKVKNYIDEKLYVIKVNKLDLSKENFDPVPIVEQILSDLSK